MEKIVVLSGAGVSAESGLKTFRDNDGLWEKYDVMEVATPQAWNKNPQMVLEFYNQRRKQVLAAEPNKAHHVISELQSKYQVDIVTQNIDDLHERAGSKNVLHLHGLITQGRSSIDPNNIIDLPNERIEWGDKSEDGSQIRPHVVWFGEPVPQMIPAEEITRKADILIIIGTSLEVYPAAGSVHAAPRHTKKYLIDPGNPFAVNIENLIVIKEKASNGMSMLADKVL